MTLHQTLASALALLALAALPSCATDKLDVDAAAIDSLDVNDAKEDSLRKPTVMGTVEVGSVVTGALTRRLAFHAYDYTYAGQSGLVRLDAKSTEGDDLLMVAYRMTAGRWVLADWNDDCGDGSLNACLALPATAGRYRLIVTTYDGLLGAPVPARYTFSVNCKDGDCLAPTTCGGLLGTQCAAGSYCHFPLEATCGAGDQTGVCEPIAEYCLANYNPVCGCDGETYSNACHAAAAGVSIVSEDACPTVACGGRAGNTCDDTQYCDFERGAICGRADGQGTCAARPEVCAEIYQPVCGCDNVTYENECSAAVAGVGVLQDGACP